MTDAPTPSAEAEGQSTRARLAAIVRIIDPAAFFIDNDGHAIEQAGHEAAWNNALALQAAFPALSAPPPTGDGGLRTGIYVASKTSHAGMWRSYRANGQPIISTWIDEAGAGETVCFADLWTRCTDEAMSAKAVIFYHLHTDQPLKGALVEVGAALGAGVPVFVVSNATPLLGSWTNHPLVTIVHSLEAAFLRAGLVALSAPLPQAQPGGEPTWLHVKSGRRYRVVGHFTLEADVATEMVAYVDATDSRKSWLRPVAEFYDGRFQVQAQGGHSDGSGLVSSDGRQHPMGARDDPASSAPAPAPPPPEGAQPGGKGTTGLQPFIPQPLPMSPYYFQDDPSLRGPTEVVAPYKADGEKAPPDLSAPPREAKADERVTRKRQAIEDRAEAIRARAGTSPPREAPRTERAGAGVREALRQSTATLSAVRPYLRPEHMQAVAERVDANLSALSALEAEG